MKSEQANLLKDACRAAGIPLAGKFHLAEVQEIVGCGRKAIMTAARDGRLRVIGLPRARWVLRQDLEGFLLECCVKQDAAEDDLAA